MSIAKVGQADIDKMPLKEKAVLYSHKLRFLTGFVSQIRIRISMIDRIEFKG